MVAKNHKKGRPSSELERRRLEWLAENGMERKRVKFPPRKTFYGRFDEEE